MLRGQVVRRTFGTGGIKNLLILDNHDTKLILQTPRSFFLFLFHFDVPFPLLLHPSLLRVIANEISPLYKGLHKEFIEIHFNKDFIEEIKRISTRGSSRRLIPQTKYCYLYERSYVTKEER